MIPLSNRQVVEAAINKRKIQVVVQRPKEVGGTAYDEPMCLTAVALENDNYSISVPLQGVKSWVISTKNNKRFSEEDRGYTFMAYYHDSVDKP